MNELELELNELKLNSLQQEPTTPELNTPRTVTLNNRFVFPPSPTPVDNEINISRNEGNNTEYESDTMLKEGASKRHIPSTSLENSSKLAQFNNGNKSDEFNGNHLAHPSRKPTG